MQLAFLTHAIGNFAEGLFLKVCPWPPQVLAVAAVVGLVVLYRLLGNSKSSPSRWTW